MAGDQPRRQRTEPTPPTKPTPAPATSGPLTETEEERYKRARLRVIGLSLEFGFTTIGSLVFCLGGGIWLDRRFGTSPLFLMIGLVLAFLSVGYTLYQLASVKTGPRPPRKAATEATSQPRRPANNWDDEDERDKDDDWPVRRGKGG